MPAEIRRTLLQVQTTYKEGWKEVATPTKLVAALAVIRNPWFGRGHVEDLSRLGAIDRVKARIILQAMRASRGQDGRHALDRGPPTSRTVD